MVAFVIEPTFRRARHPEQKEQRRAHLLATARASLVGGVAVRALGLNELARQAGMAKANVYTYFESREALLLALLWDEWVQWFAGLGAAWRRRRRRGDGLDAVARLLARTLADAPLLCELTAALPTVLEQNLSEAAIAAFKQQSLAFFMEIGQFLEGCAPALPAAAYVDLIHDTAHAIVALYPATHPSPAAARALDDPQLAFFRRKFEPELERFIAALAQEHARRLAAGSPRSRAQASHAEGRRRTSRATVARPNGA
jgi:AcrR family transcriptional regulator